MPIEAPAVWRRQPLRACRRALSLVPGFPLRIPAPPARSPLARRLSQRGRPLEPSQPCSPDPGRRVPPSLCPGAPSATHRAVGGQRSPWALCRRPAPDTIAIVSGPPPARMHCDGSHSIEPSQAACRSQQSHVSRLLCAGGVRHACQASQPLARSTSLARARCISLASCIPLSRLTTPDRLHCALHASRLPHAHTLALRCARFRAFVRAPSLHPVRRTCLSPFHRVALLSLAVLPLRRATRPCSVPSRTHSTIPSTEKAAQSYMSVCLAFISSPPLCALGRSSILPK